MIVPGCLGKVGHGDGRKRLTLKARNAFCVDLAFMAILKL